VSKTQLIWFKKDLRLSDHAPLSEAAERGPVLAVYIYEDEVIGGEDFDARHLRFLNECLEEVRAGLRSLGGELVLRRGEAVSVLRGLRAESGFDAVWSHEETGNAITYARDRRVARWCREEGIDWREIPQTGVVRRLANRDGWAARWNRRMSGVLVEAPRRIRSPRLEPGPLLFEESFDLPTAGGLDLQRGGRTEGLRLQESFFAHRGRHYRREMSSPVTAEESCSRLSPYFTWGCLSIREAYQAGRSAREAWRQAKEHGEKPENGWAGSLQSYLGRLRWHCHFMQKLEDEPSIEFENFARVCDGLRENDWNQDRFDAWREGQTGYPLVDAVMRCLQETGWINFRMRAMVMSFSSYHLWLHWRKPSLHLARVFTDYEPGIHYSQAQMQSGCTGINTIRIYSPVKQAKEQDPTGEFIRRWVPELEGVPDALLAEPHRMTVMEQQMAGCRIGVDYPEPVVDHATAYRAAREKMFALRKSSGARQEASRIQQKHGSRRRASRQWR